MTTATTRRVPLPARLVLIAASLALGALLVIGAWQFGEGMRPDVADAAAERGGAYEDAYTEARADAYAAAYAEAWDPAFERGAEAGRTEGTAAGTAAARAELAAAR